MPRPNSRSRRRKSENDSSTVDYPALVDESPVWRLVIRYGGWWSSALLVAVVAIAWSMFHTERVSNEYTQGLEVQIRDLSRTVTALTSQRDDLSRKLSEAQNNHSAETRALMNKQAELQQQLSDTKATLKKRDSQIKAICALFSRADRPDECR